VRAAAELRVLGARRSACRVRNDLVKLEQASLLATIRAALTGTPAPITVPDGTLDGSEGL
jgi:hypothetical protein